MKKTIFALTALATIAGAVTAQADTATILIAGPNGTGMYAEFVETLAGKVSPAQWVECTRDYLWELSCTTEAVHYDGIVESQVTVNGAEVATTDDTRASLNTLNSSFVVPDSLTTQETITVYTDLALEFNTNGYSYTNDDIDKLIMPDEYSSDKHSITDRSGF